MRITLQKQEAQLMLTNLRDAFRGQSTSPNIVPFHMLGIGHLQLETVSTLSLIQLHWLPVRWRIYFKLTIVP